MRFRVFYADGTVYAGDVWHTPAFGVVLILQEDSTPVLYNEGRRYLYGADYYCWHADRGWDKHDLAGLLQYFDEVGQQRVVVGAAVRADVFHKIKARAEAMKDFAPRNLGEGLK